MTWVTVQSHDIGDTFPGIYALEKVFSVGSAGAICSCAQEQKRVVRVAVWSFWDQSQERLQVVAALSGWWSKSFGGCFASAAPPRENAPFCLANAVVQSCARSIRAGEQKSCDVCCKRAFPGPRRVPAVSTLARWLVELHLVKKRKRRARRGPLLPWRAVHAPKGCNQVWTIDFKGWFRTGDGRRCEPLTVRDLFSRFVLAVALLPNQSDAAVRRALVQVFRRYGLPKVIRVDNGAPFGGKGALGLSRLSVWWLRLGIAVEFVRPAHPQDNGAHEQMHRVFRADVASSTGTQRSGAETTHSTLGSAAYNHQRPHEALGQRVPAQIYWPSNRPMPEQLPKVNYPCAWDTRRVRNRGHIKWQGRERFIGRAFVGAIGRAEKDGRGHPRSLSRLPSHWLALRARSSRNATGLHRASSLRLSACPPLESKRAAWRRAPEQTAAPPSSYLASLFRRAPSHPKCKSVTHVMRPKCHPCHETVPARALPRTSAAHRALARSKAKAE